MKLFNFFKKRKAEKQKIINEEILNALEEKEEEKEEEEKEELIKLFEEIKVGGKKRGNVNVIKEFSEKWKALNPVKYPSKLNSYEVVKDFLKER